MTASIWEPGSTPNLNTDATVKTQRFVASAGQSVFTLTSFSYVVGTDSLLVFKNGNLLAPGVDVFESTTTTFTLATAAIANDEIIAVGFVGITGTVTVNTVDIFVDNVAAMRSYAGANDMLYLKNTAAPPTGIEGMFQKFTGAGPGTYVDDGVNVIVPTGGDGSAAWLRATEQVRRTAIQLDTVSQAEAEARAATTTRTWTAQRVGQAIAAGITAIVTGSFIATLYEALSNTNKYTDAEKTKLASLAVGAAVASGHIRAGNTQLWGGDGDPGATFDVDANIAISTFETVGPTGSGADNVWATMDQLPAEATVLIVDIEVVFANIAAASTALSTMNAVQGDVVSPAANTIHNGIYTIQKDFDAAITGNNSIILPKVQIPLGPTNKDFHLRWTLSNATAAIVLYYRGFMTDA